MSGRRMDIRRIQQKSAISRKRPARGTRVAGHWLHADCKPVPDLRTTYMYDLEPPGWALCRSGIGRAMPCCPISPTRWRILYCRLLIHNLVSTPQGPIIPSHSIKPRPNRHCSQELLLLTAPIAIPATLYMFPKPSDTIPHLLSTQTHWFLYPYHCIDTVVCNLDAVVVVLRA